MADNVAITAGTGTSIATDERSIGGSTVQVQRVDEQGATAIATGQASCTSTLGTAKVAARDTRKRLVMYNVGPNDVFVGPTGITVSTGLILNPGTSCTLYTTAALFALCNTSETATLHYVEEYDA